MQNASWLAVEADQALQPVARVHDRDAGHPGGLDELQRAARPDRRAPRAACRRARAARSGRRRSSGRSAGVSVPRKRSPSVTSSSFLRGLKNVAGLGERHRGADGLGPAHHHVADGGPGFVDRDVDRRTHGSPKCGARLSRNARTPSRPSGAAASPAIVRASSSSCWPNVAGRGAAQQPLDRAVRADRAVRRAAARAPRPRRRARRRRTTRVTMPELLRARRGQALVEQRELHRAAHGRRSAAASSSRRRRCGSRSRCRRR